MLRSGYYCGMAADASVLYFIVKGSNGYEIWEMTADELYERTQSDPTLLQSRLDHHPFTSRSEAEWRIKVLTSD